MIARNAHKRSSERRKNQWNVISASFVQVLLFLTDSHSPIASSARCGKLLCDKHHKCICHLSGTLSNSRQQFVHALSQSSAFRRGESGIIIVFEDWKILTVDILPDWCVSQDALQKSRNSYDCCFNIVGIRSRNESRNSYDCCFNIVVYGAETNNSKAVVKQPYMVWCLFQWYQAMHSRGQWKLPVVSIWKVVWHCVDDL